MLSDVQAWYKSEDAYKGEAIGNQLVGFTVLFPTPTTPTSELRHLPYDLFLDASRKWHKRLAMGFIAAFKSGEYMHIKNSILVLTKIAPVFPTEYDVGSDLDKAVTALIAKETREDLKILAQGYAVTNVAGLMHSHAVFAQIQGRLVETSKVLAQSAQTCDCECLLSSRKFAPPADMLFIIARAAGLSRAIKGSHACNVKCHFDHEGRSACHCNYIAIGVKTELGRLTCSCLLEQFCVCVSCRSIEQRASH